MGTKIRFPKYFFLVFFWVCDILLGLLAWNNLLLEGLGKTNVKAKISLTDKLVQTPRLADEMATEWSSQNKIMAPGCSRVLSIHHVVLLFKNKSMDSK